MKLAHYAFGEENRDNGTLVILHGLFGQARNWTAIARRLAEKYHVVTADLRNHGRSGWDTDMTYSAMAADIAELIRDIDNGAVHLIGHSMGGKASMTLALSDDAGLIADLVVVDIAPLPYQHDYNGYISAMRAVDFDAISRRAEVEEALASGVSEKGIRQFLAQNVVTDKDSGKMSWQVNIDAMAEHLDDITGWHNADGAQYQGDTLFIAGANSSYVDMDRRDDIKALFPKASFTSIKNAGHWVHAEKPDAVLMTLSAFLNR
ncbi:alpha/beta fold hydrolase [Thalassospira sp. TSL5-1]|uniref:alpha/beta fold hydrolase n=1 Tax=Thalassospira sp. TSL5-1 TaxID=1544451 RepID=UPI00093B5C70|nr:alpha/beta fold hydrolase [Thalassospira sp. TSL5-1]OKH89281.1 alpha/beta hydrolase [Thalassospira sp. TSL5-1]